MSKTVPKPFKRVPKLVIKRLEEWEISGQRPKSPDIFGTSSSSASSNNIFLTPSATGSSITSSLSHYTPLTCRSNNQSGSSASALAKRKHTSSKIKRCDSLTSMSSSGRPVNNLSTDDSDLEASDVHASDRFKGLTANKASEGKRSARKKVPKFMMGYTKRRRPARKPAAATASRVRIRKPTIDCKPATDSDSSAVEEDSPIINTNVIITRNRSRSMLIERQQATPKKNPVVVIPKEEQILPDTSSSDEEPPQRIIEWSPEAPSMPSLTEPFAKRAVPQKKSAPKSDEQILDQICKLTPVAGPSKPAITIKRNESIDVDPNKVIMHIIDDDQNRILYQPNTKMVGNFKMNVHPAIRKNPVGRKPRLPKKRFETVGTQTEISIEALYSTIREIRNCSEFQTTIQPGDGTPASMVSVDISRINMKPNFFLDLMAATNNYNPKPRPIQKGRGRLVNRRSLNGSVRNTRIWKGQRQRLLTNNSIGSFQTTPSETSMEQQSSGHYSGQQQQSSLGNHNVSGIETMPKSPTEYFREALDNNIFVHQLENTATCLTNAISHTNNVLETNQYYQYGTIDNESNTVVFYEQPHNTQITTETVNSQQAVSMDADPIVNVVHSHKKIKKFRNPFSNTLRLNPFAAMRNKVQSPPPGVVNNVPLLQTPKQSWIYRAPPEQQPVEIEVVHANNSDMEIEMFGMNDFLNGTLDINSLPIEGFSHIPYPDIGLFTPKKEVKEEIEDEDALCIDEAKEHPEVAVQQERCSAPVQGTIDVGPETTTNEPPPQILPQPISNEKKATSPGGNEPITTAVVEEVASKTMTPTNEVPQKENVETGNKSQSISASHADSDLDYEEEDDCLSICASQINSPTMDFDDDADDPPAPLPSTSTTNEQLDKVVKETFSQAATESKQAPASPVKREPQKKFDMSKLKGLNIKKTITNDVVASINRSSILNYYPDPSVVANRNQKPGVIHLTTPSPLPGPRAHQQQQQKRSDDEQVRRELNLFGPPVRTNKDATDGTQVIRLNTLPAKRLSVDDDANAYDIDDVMGEMTLFAEATGLEMFDGLGGFPKIPHKLPQMLLQPKPVIQPPVIMPPPLVQPFFPPPSLAVQQQPDNRLLHQLNQIFEFPCSAYLLDKCLDGHNCHFNHALPDNNRVKDKLFSLPHDVLLASYTFVEERHNLFNKYFRVYCEVFGRRKMRENLIRMIPDCEKPHRDVFCYHEIVKGLMFSELSRVTAVKIIIDKHKHKVFKTLDVLIELICDCGDEAPKFIENLRYFAAVTGYQIQNSSIEQLLQIGRSTGNKDLIGFLTAQLMAATPFKLQSANKDMIMHFLNMVNEMDIIPNFSETLMIIMEKLP